MTIIKVGDMDNSDGTFECCNRVYSQEGLAPTLPTNAGGDHVPKVICRMTGRNPDNPKSRVPGLPTRQVLEPNQQGMCGTITTVQKDNLVVEGETSPTLTTDGNDVCRVESRYRIRKLTPRETWRLMGFDDADYDKASSVNSNTQLYKQAGNSIVKQVLMAIFSKMM